jgi:tripartite-type tricarboxylate transporter receptor subunit TctC
VVIDNRGGAGGIIGAETVARAKPDGYTLYLSTTGTLAINPSLYEKLRYDPQKDFEPIGLISTTNNVLVVRNGLPANNIQELIALAKKDPDGLTYASSGNGSSNHLTMELFKTMTGVQIRHVPYKGVPPIRIDIHEARIDMLFGVEATAFRDFAQAEKARALMTSGKTRSVFFPDVPTAEEVGLKGYDLTIWFGLNAPKGTPSAILERINKELNAILDTPEMKKELANEGQIGRPMSTQEYGAFLLQERQKWTPIVKASGAKAE